MSVIVVNWTPDASAAAKKKSKQKSAATSKKNTNTAASNQQANAANDEEDPQEAEPAGKTKDTATSRLNAAANANEESNSEDAESESATEETSAKDLSEADSEPSEQDDDEETAGPKQPTFFYDGRKNPHPSAATAYATRRLILSFQKPPEARLNVCVREFRAMADSSQNSDSLVQSMKLMAAAVEKNPTFYHWCFYHFVAALDWKLEEDSIGLQLQDKMTMFTKNTKGLWLLARALDESEGTRIYFEFLKVRYVDMSKQHFGRNLEVISPPLGDPRWIEPMKYFKPAEAFQEK